MQVTPQLLGEVLDDAIRANLESALRGEPPEKRDVPLVIGPPGVGKTTIIRKAGQRVNEDKDFLDYICEEAGIERTRYFTRTVHTAQMEAADVAGLPWAGTNDQTGEQEMIKIRPDILPYPGQLCTFFADEFGKGKVSVINAMSQCLLEYRIGPHQISPYCTFVLASNARKDKSGDIDLPRHTYDRCTYYELVLSRTQWLEWATLNDIDPAVIFFIKAMPEYFDKFDEGSMINPTPRSYERVSDTLKASRLKGDALRANIEGKVGPSSGHALFSFMKLRDKLTPPEIILAKPNEVTIPDDRQAQWAMMSTLVSAVDKKTVPGLRDFMKRFDKEVDGGRELSVMLITSLWAREKELLLTEAGVELASTYSEVLTDDLG